MTGAVLRRLAALWPREATTDPDLSRAVEFLGWDCEASVIRRASLTAATVLALVPLPVLALAPRPGRYLFAGGLCAAAVVAVAGPLAPKWLASWTIPIAALGLGCGAALVAAYRPMKAVRDEVREVESGLSDAVRLVGRRVERGAAVQTAVETVGEDRSGPTGEAFATAAARQRRLGVDVETAFLGPDGALASVPSRRAADAAALLALAAEEGRPATSALVATGDHLDDLAEIEREARREVGRVTDTLSNTAAVFVPLVGGATVALAGAMGDETALTGSTDVGGLGLAVGAYVLVMAGVLTVLATTLTRSPDRALAGYRVGLTLLAATATYLAAVAGTGMLV